MTVPALEVIRQVVAQCGARVLVAPELCSTRKLPEAHLAGARFVISASLSFPPSKCVIATSFRFSQTRSLKWSPLETGADARRSFLSALGGASYLKALKAPLPQIELIPTGAHRFHCRTVFGCWLICSRCRWRLDRCRCHRRQQDEMVTENTAKNMQIVASS